MGQSKLALIRLKTYFLSLPRIKEQKCIFEKVNQLIALCDEMESNIYKSQIDSEFLMQSILHETLLSSEEI